MRGFLLLGAFSVVGCMPVTGGQACTEEARAALNIRVVQAIGGGPICDAVVLAREGSFEEQLIAGAGSDCVYSGVYERAGTYTVEAIKSGFETGRVEGVVVGRDECHVIPESRTLELRAYRGGDGGSGN
ncbi:MAG: hypothetical protein AB2A00_40365 [Myxococcota bacterium]